jgi:hypothetical protein
VAVADLLPRLRAEGRAGLRRIGQISAVAVALAAVPVAAIGPAGAGWSAGVLIVSGVGALMVFRRTRRRVEALVMPGLARAIGLSYRQDDRAFLDSLPERLLPRASQRIVDDVVEGAIGGRTIRFAEVTLSAGGTDSRTAFRGIVAAVPNLVALPHFFLAVERETRGPAIRIGVADLTRVRNLTGPSGEVLGVWAPSSNPADTPALAAVLDALKGMVSGIGGHARLYSAMSDGRMTHVALRLDRDLFRIANPFAGEDRLAENIRRAFSELSVPVRVVSALLQAEAAVAAGVSGQGR